ncbi:MAG: hypothetical protein HY438_00785 [DPANN group archaeon]|nr:hypothetical protein [DPANN group archaeon]
MPNECVACNSGTIAWNDKNYAYRCDNCEFELPFRLSRVQILRFLHSKGNLGSIIPRGEQGLEAKLRALHNEIGATAEFERRKTHLDFLVRRHKQTVLSLWNSRVGADSEFPYYERGKWIVELAENQNIPVRVIYEILRREEKWAYASHAVWCYNLANRFGGQLKEFWERHGGRELEKTNDHNKQIKLLQKISERLGLVQYTTATAMSACGVWKGAPWAMYLQHILDEYGLRVGDLWDNRKVRVKDDYTLWEVADSISNDLGRLVSTSGVLEILRVNRRGEVKTHDRLKAHVLYKYASLCLDLIKKDGPLNAQTAAKKLGVTNVTISPALRLLHEQGKLKVHQDRRKALFYYLPNQEDALGKTARYYGLEEKILRTGKNYIIVSDLSKLIDSKILSTHSLLGKLVERGKFLVVRDAIPYLYIVRQEGRTEKAMQLEALCHRYMNILKHFRQEGTIVNNIPGNHKNTKKILGILEKYDLIYREENKYYLTHHAIKEMKKHGRKK